MKLTLPRIGDIFDGHQLRELVQLLENAFVNVVEDQRRGAITVTADYTLTKEDSLVLVAPVAAATVVITVPEVADWMVKQKWEWSLKLTAAGTLNIVPDTSTIDGGASISTAVVNTAYTIRATPDGWKTL